MSVSKRGIFADPPPEPPVPLPELLELDAIPAPVPCAPDPLVVPSGSELHATQPNAKAAKTTSDHEDFVDMKEVSSVGDEVWGEGRRRRPEAPNVQTWYQGATMYSAIIPPSI